MFQDYLFFGTDVRVQYAFRMLHLSHLAQHAKVIHKLSTNRSLLLAEVLTGSLLLSSVLEEEERINVRVQAGDAFTIAAECTRHAESARGYGEFNDASECVVTLDGSSEPLNRVETQFPVILRSLRSVPGKSQLFEGRTQSVCQGFSLESAFHEHLSQSYQMYTHLKLSCWHDPQLGLRAFGAIFQELPDADPETLHSLRQHVAQLPPLHMLVSGTEDPDALAKALIPDPVHPVKSVNPKWGCTCSQETIEATLSRLPPADLADMISDKKPAEVTCHYCSKNFYVSLAKLETFLTSKTISSQKSNQLN